jgi:hypothetical protein
MDGAGTVGDEATGGGTVDDDGFEFPQPAIRKAQSDRLQTATPQFNIAPSKSDSMLDLDQRHCIAPVQRDLSPEQWLSTQN